MIFISSIELNDEKYIYIYIYNNNDNIQYLYSAL